MTSFIRDLIAHHIRMSGPMDIATYMTICLTHPQHGYYTAGSPVGARGDFTTAPEISQLFGEMIGFWVADIWAQMGKPSPFYLTELGPGRGTLMADMMRIIARIPGMTDGVRIHLVEVSEPLISEQAMALSGYDVTWHDQMDDVPDDAPIIIVNNEFFDALPVRQLVYQAGGVSEVVVGLDDIGAFAFGRAARAGIDVPAGTPDGSVIEIAPMRDHAADMIATRVMKQRGAALIIDYGYDMPIHRSTIQAVRGHEKVSFLDTPGEADLTALVDFSAIVHRARMARADIAGPISQGAFLRNLGISSRAENVCKQANDAQRTQIMDGMSRLLDEGQMGSLFKALCIYNGVHNIKPAGFDHV